MTCPECKNEIPENVEYCFYCFALGEACICIEDHVKKHGPGTRPTPKEVKEHVFDKQFYWQALNFLYTDGGIKLHKKIKESWKKEKGEYPTNKQVVRYVARNFEKSHKQAQEAENDLSIPIDEESKKYMEEYGLTPEEFLVKVFREAAKERDDVFVMEGDVVFDKGDSN